jgi:hypothetical protein
VTDEDPYGHLDGMKRAELPGTPASVATALDSWMHQVHGHMSSAHGVGTFLDILWEMGYVVEPRAVASARSYTTIETASMERRPDPDPGLTEGQIKAEDPTWHTPPDEEPPVRTLG